MRTLLKRLVVLLILGAAFLIVRSGLHIVALNRQANRLIKESDSLAIGCGKADVLAAMPNDLLVSIGPLTADEGAETRYAVTALRYNAPVFLNSVYVLLLFDQNDQLIAKRRFD